MANQITPRYPGAVQRPAQPVQGMTAGMTTCQIAGIALGAVVLGIVLSQIPDIIRYSRMVSMSAG